MELNRSRYTWSNVDVMVSLPHISYNVDIYHTSRKASHFLRVSWKNIRTGRPCFEHFWRRIHIYLQRYSHRSRAHRQILHSLELSGLIAFQLKNELLKEQAARLSVKVKKKYFRNLPAILICLYLNNFLSLSRSYLNL